MEMAQKKLKMKLGVFFVILVVLIIIPSKVFAESTYVLPYPSSMPGGFFYKIDKVQEIFDKYWYFGNFGEFKYNLRYSDKYLVEAKVLFDYKQYLLGYKALLKSDEYFKHVKPALVKASWHNENISEKTDLLKEASIKHVEELTKLKETVPENFNWIPEKSSSTFIPLKKSIDNSIQIRNKSE